ncbi:MAG: beta-propeller fold lactonase family protein [Terracidiphilus sp.]
MKFSKSSQLFLVSSIGLLVAALLTACSITTIDYVFVASSSGIETYAVDSQSGALRPGAATVTSGVNSPVAMAVTSDYAHLYVANAGNNTVVHFAIGMNGELSPKDTVTLSGTPVSLAVNTAGTYLYVTSPAPPTSCSGPNPGATLTAYPLASGTIGAASAPAALCVPQYAGDTIVPTGVTVLANNDAVFVTAYDQSAYNPGCTPAPACTPSTANPGWVFSFVVGSGGSLAPAANSPYEAGVKPSALVSDPTDRFVYVTDYASNELIGYTILDGSTLSFLTNGPFKTGGQPSAIAMDPRGKFIYVTNALDSTVSPYAITLSNGTPTVALNLIGNQINPTDTEPVAIAVDPALGRFVYTANHLDNSISGFRLDPNSGAVTPTQATPYNTGLKPTALVIVPHGNHATQSITP